MEYNTGRIDSAIITADAIDEMGRKDVVELFVACHVTSAGAGALLHPLAGENARVRVQRSML
jgi:hypothetical protein